MTRTTLTSVPDHDQLKAQAADLALELVRPGMLLGIGTGTTMRFFIERLGRRVAQGLNVAGVPTSRESAEIASSLGVPLVDDPTRRIDLAVDGADEVAPDLGLIKGRGGALTREKLVAVTAQRFIVIVDDSKLVDHLGRSALPVEVVPFFWRLTAARLVGLGSEWRLRQNGTTPYVTDNGNLILDLQFPEPLADPAALAVRLKQTVGVIEHGLFLGLATAAIVSSADGVHVLGSLPTSSSI
jgi:ribose 5-phosphate isomerase A